jgi:triphosphoribosyl-dephospho-CoA synthetase
MSENGSLSTRQRKFIVAVTTQSSVRDAAAAAGIGESTAWRYLADDAVREAIRRQLDAMLAQATAGVVADMGEARSTLLAIMRNVDVAPGVRVRAALGVLRCGLTLFEALSLADRVSDLERRIREDDDASD